MLKWRCSYNYVVLPTSINNALEFFIQDHYLMCSMFDEWWFIRHVLIHSMECAELHFCYLMRSLRIRCLRKLAVTWRFVNNVLEAINGKYVIWCFHILIIISTGKTAWFFARNRNLRNLFSRICFFSHSHLFKPIFHGTIETEAMI